MPPNSADFTDGWLLLLLDWATAGTLVVDLSLMIGGLVVCGTPVSYEEFAGRFGDAIVEGTEVMSDPESTELIRSIFTEVGQRETDRYYARREEFRQLLTELRVDRDPPLPDEVQDAIRERLYRRSRNYVVLKDVEIHGASPSPTRVPLWRGRLNEVTGWHVGRWQVP